MYIIKNAYKSIIRTKGRTALIFILVLLIATSSCIALSIRNSAESAKQSTYDSLKITAQISLDRQKVMGSGTFDKSTMSSTLSQSLSLDELSKYAESEYVNNFYYSSSAGMNVPEGFNIYETESSQDSQMGGGKMSKNRGDVTVYGYSSHDAMTSFISGETVISEGEVFDQDSTDNSCIISYELANLNDLSVNDTIILVNPSKEDQTYTFKISGIFKNDSSDAYANYIFTSYASLSNVIADTQNNAETTTNDRGQETTTAISNHISGTYVFADIDNYNDFCSDVKSMGLDTDTYTVTSTDVEQFEKSVAPLESLSKFTMIFFIIVLLIGGAILVVFNLFNVRERKYEIGVLAAIGMKKGKVATQFLIESFIVTFIAIIVGTGIGTVCAEPIGNYLLKEQVASAQSTAETTSQNFGGKFQGESQSDKGSMSMHGSSTSSSTKVDYLDEIDATADFSVLASLMGIALLLTLVASSVGMISVLRYEPLKILSERS